MSRPHPVAALLIVGFVATIGLASSSAQAQQRAGEVEELDGDASAVGTDGRIRELDEDDDIFSGDTVRTGSGASVLIVFEDETQFSIGADAEMTIDRFVYDPSNDSGAVLASVTKGLFRFVSGSVAASNPAAMTVSTPVATIGIRGTHVAGEVVGTTAEVALLEDEDGGAGQIQVANNAGSVVIAEANFFTRVPGPNQPPTPPQRMAQNRINQFMSTLRSMQRRFNRPRIRP